MQPEREFVISAGSPDRGVPGVRKVDQISADLPTQPLRFMVSFARAAEPPGTRRPHRLGHAMTEGLHTMIRVSSLEDGRAPLISRRKSPKGFGQTWRHILKN